MNDVPWRPDAVIALAEKAGDWQLANLTTTPGTAWSEDSTTPTSWEQGVLFVGLMALAERSHRPEFREAVLARSCLTGWQPGPRPYHADEYVIASSYLWSHRHGAGDAAIAPTRARLDAILAVPSTASLDFSTPDCQDRWCWCDALFMAPPVWLEMAKATGEAKYADFARAEFRATADYLYDPAESLFYRDSRFFAQRDDKGRKLFWSRGNGWVFASLARILPLLQANDPDRAWYVDLFRAMATRLKTLQKPDGYWPPSLLGDAEASPPETSGTGFHTFAFAWGIKVGLLDRAAYEPAVRKGWAALVRALHPDGKLGYVQPVGYQPEQVGYDNTQFFGVGAFLLAAMAVADLDLAVTP